MTRQELFNKAIKGLAAQGFERSMLPGDTVVCAYRDGPKKCFVGQLIPDHLYHPSFDGGCNGLHVFTLLERSPELKEHLLPSDVANEDLAQQWLARAQECHDSAGTPAMMMDEYRHHATVYGLELPPELQ